MLAHIKMTNVVQFKKNKEVFVLKFKTQDVIRFTKRDEHHDIMLEVHQNKGTAWVPALNKNEARKRLHSMMSVLEWVEEHTNET
ncbi:MAG: hypothetical protein CMA31_00690 [Euryarchaeota archaeon]|nr:hypothetical protein [Euryarchaeota archaeon]